RHPAPDPVHHVVHQLDVGGGTHERQRDEVHAELQREFQVLDVLFGQGGHRHVHAGQRDALVVGDRPALGHPADDVVAVDAHDDQADLAVVDQQAVAGLGIGGELLVGGGNTVVR